LKLLRPKSEIRPERNENTVINVTPANLCRVSGTGLRPLSRTDFSKQFVGLLGNDSIFHHEASDLKTGKQHALLKAKGNNVNVNVE